MTDGAEEDGGEPAQFSDDTLGQGFACLEVTVTAQIVFGAIEFKAEFLCGGIQDLQGFARRPDICLLSATDGSRGIEIARASLPDMILMDINLPGISGIQALKILREDTATAHIPVVALSGNAIPRDIKKGLEAGFFRYVTKPINVNEFMNTLDATLKFAKAESPHADSHVTWSEPL